MTSFDVDYQRVLNYAADTLHIAQARGYDISEDWQSALARHAAAQKIAIEPEPVRGPLPDPKSLKTYIDSHATTLDAWRRRVAVARDVLAQTEREAGQVALAAAPAIAAQVTKDANDKLLPRMLDLLDTAARTLTGHETPKELAAHADLLRVVQDVSAAIADRARLAIIIGEGADLGRGGALFLLVNPRPETSMAAIAAAVRRIGEGLPATVDDWAQLAPLSLSFAAPGEALNRYGQYQQALAANQFTPDMGQLDHTLGHMLNIRRPAAA